MEYFQEVKGPISAKCDMLINLTRSGSHLHGPDIIKQRPGPMALQPEICSLDIGSVNFVDGAFVNPPD
ncbi:MAG TPA: 3-keto-5-aminohexanoate cleavage protein [Anaerolineae bacterium]|nr:3-keto-5-aminohexanoate cleavage protein [Anaerolineae bacterium]